MKKWILLLFCTVSFSASAATDLNGRENVASSLFGATAEIKHADGRTNAAPGVISGSHKDEAGELLSGVPSLLTIEFAKPEQINLIRIYPGKLLYAGNPSGECGVKSYIVERFNNGYWHPLVKAENQPGFQESGASDGETYFFEHSFPPVNAAKLRITVLRSGHTGKSASAPGVVAEEKRSSFLRAVEVYSARRSESSAAWLSSAMSGDFRLRVYRAQESAALNLKGIRFGKPFEAVLVLTEEKTGKPMETRSVTLKNGEQSLSFPLKNIPDGRYILTIKAKDPASPFKGEFRRMLRIDRGGTTPPPSEPIDVTGIKVFPVDDFHFAKRSGVRESVPEAEAIETSRRMGPEMGRQNSRSGNWLNLDSEGNFVQKFEEYSTDGKNAKTYYAVSRDLKNWNVLEKTPTGKANVPVKSPFAPLPPAAVPHWGQKTPLKDASVRFYDKGKDGIPPLNEIRIQWFPPFLGDATKYGLVKWGTYPVWEKKKGEWIVLNREPIFVEKFGFAGDELETEKDCNDNFGPQYLSDDGKTLFYGKAAKLRTFPPYTIEYDNIPQAYRLMQIHYTNDGFRWKKRYFTLPDESDPWSSQHYGYSSFRVDRNFYVAYVHMYHCVNQQIYPEINYSRDGLNWKRIPGGRTPFIRNTPPNTWLFGLIFCEYAPFPLEHDGKYYLPVGTAWKRPHFYLPSETPELTGTVLRRSFHSRGLEKEWPYFKEIGGWDPLALSMKNALNTVGIAVFRKDGWIAVKSEGNGELLSRVFSAKDCVLALNAKGKLVLELLSPDGTPLPQYSGPAAVHFSGDETDWKATWKNGTVDSLPKTPFRIRIQMAPGSEIYSLSFLKQRNGDSK